jgi:hypothetical protein
MNAHVVKPGHIRQGLDLTPSVLEAQWKMELRHRNHNVDLSALAFSKSDWVDLEWNAKEALFVNGKWSRYPGHIRKFFIDQDAVNIHLIRTYQKLLGAWQQWTHLPYVRSIASLPSPSECTFLLGQAWARLDRAHEKYYSLTEGKHLLREFSLRQWRLFQHLSALLADLDPLVRGTADYLKRHGNNRDSSVSLEKDILWHTRELQVLLGRLDSRPGLKARIRAPRLEINRLLAQSCLLQADFLRTLT